MEFVTVTLRMPEVPKNFIHEHLTFRQCEVNWQSVQTINQTYNDYGSATIGIRGRTSNALGQIQEFFLSHTAEYPEVDVVPVYSCSFVHRNIFGHLIWGVKFEYESQDWGKIMFNEASDGARFGQAENNGTDVFELKSFLKPLTVEERNELMTRMPGQSLG